MVIGGHFGGGDHFDGRDHFGGGTEHQNWPSKIVTYNVSGIQHSCIL